MVVVGRRIIDCNGNERADILAKKGASKQQPERPVSQATRQITRSNTQIEWLIQRALGIAGRAVFTHMADPHKNTLGLQRT